MNFRKLMLKAAAFTVGLLILSIVISLPFYYYDMSKLNEALEEGSKTISSPYGTIEYVDIGEGIPVLISHGTMGGYDFGALQAQSYLSGKYRLIVPSRFGYLRSSMAQEPSFETQADSYAYLLDFLNVDKVIVEGMSAGGVPAMQFAARYPEKCAGLILLSTVAYAPPSVYKAQDLPVPSIVYDTMLKSDYLFWVLLKLTPASVHNIAGASERLKRNCSPDELEMLNRLGWSFLPVSKRFAGWKQDSRNINGLGALPLDQITAPTLIVSADDDTVAPQAWSRYTAEQISGSRLITFETGGHMLLGHMEELSDMTGRFINETYPEENSKRLP
ncbi:MAG: hydrolase [Bacillota bacterium]|jgi:pimeloyl-ACP methyl ester carboxylesterase|nr:hydrolase [Bacillota bacterium]